MSRGNEMQNAECRAQNEIDRRGRRSLLRRALFAFCILHSAFLLTGCRQKMGNAARYDPLEASNFFADGMSARPRVANTVARGEMVADPYYETGKMGGQLGDGFPFPITAADLDRGHERFNAYCSQCHGRLGDGNGMIPARGFRRPPSFHTATLRAAKTGHFFDVITNGFGAMPPHRTIVPVRDRWLIAAYIRALQMSQSVNAAELPAGEVAKIGAPAPAAAAAHGGAH